VPSGLTVGQWERETTFLGFPLIEEYDFNGGGSYFWAQILFLDDLPALFLLESGWYETFDTFPEQIHIHADSTFVGCAEQPREFEYYFPWQDEQARVICEGCHEAIVNRFDITPKEGEAES